MLLRRPIPMSRDRAKLRANFARAEIPPGSRRESGAVCRFRNVKTVRLAGFATKKQDRNNCRNLKLLEGYGAIACATSDFIWPFRWGPTEGTGLATLGTLVRDAGYRSSRTPDHGLSERRRFESLHADSSVVASSGNSGVACHHGALDCRWHSRICGFELSSQRRDGTRLFGRVCGVDAGRIRIEHIIFIARECFSLE